MPDYAPIAEQFVPSNVEVRNAARVHLCKVLDATARALVALDEPDDQAAWAAVVTAQDAIDAAASRLISL